MFDVSSKCTFPENSEMFTQSSKLTVPKLRLLIAFGWIQQSFLMIEGIMWSHLLKRFIVSFPELFAIYASNLSNSSLKMQARWGRLRHFTGNRLLRQTRAFTINSLLRRIIRHRLWEVVGHLFSLNENMIASVVLRDDAARKNRIQTTTAEFTKKTRRSRSYNFSLRSFLSLVSCLSQIGRCGSVAAGKARD